MHKRYYFLILLIAVTAITILAYYSKSTIVRLYKSYGFVSRNELRRSVEDCQTAIRNAYLLSVESNRLFDYEWAPTACINEVALNNSSIKDEENEKHPYLELYNPTNISYNLEGYAISNKNFKWSFPDVNIPPRGHLIVWLSGKNRANYFSTLHTSFTVNEGDTLILKKKVQKNNYEIIDEVEVKNNPLGMSQSRNPDGKEFYTQRKSPGLSNNWGGVVVMFDDKRIDNHINYREVFSTFDARVTFNINAAYYCQFLERDNKYGLPTNFGDSLSPKQIYNYRLLINDGHEIGGHHYDHIWADEYIEQFGGDAYMQKQIFSLDSLFYENQFPKIRSFVYSGHRRNKQTDSLLNSRFFNYRGVYKRDYYFKWDNSRLIKGTRLDHEAEDPNFLYKLLFEKMPVAVDSSYVLVLYGHGVTSRSEVINRYTSTRTLKLLFARARELGLKIYTQSELFSLTKPLAITNILTTNSRNDNQQAGYFELKNISESSINIQGFHININRNKTTSLQIKDQYILQPKESLKVYFGETHENSEDLFLGFPVSKSDRVYLLWPDFETVICRSLIGTEAFSVNPEILVQKEDVEKVLVYGLNDTILPNDDFEFFSSNNKIFTVDDYGVIKAMMAGSAELAIRSKFTGNIKTTMLVVHN